MGRELVALYCRAGDPSAGIVAAKEVLASSPADLWILALLANSLYDIADYDAAMPILEAVASLDINVAREGRCLVRLAYLVGRLRRPYAALGYYSMQHSPLSFTPTNASLFGLAVSTLEDKGQVYFLSVDEKVDLILQPAPGPKGRTAVFFFSPGNALGHAVLEPFWLLNLVHEQFDRIVFVGATHAASTPAVRTALQIVGQYVERFETDDTSLVDLSWMDFGDLRTDKVTYIFRDYRRLARAIYDARLDPTSPLAAARRHFSLPPQMIALGERIAAARGLDLSRPIVVIHVREHGFHKLGVQAFRNADIDNYLPAIRMLMDLGYLVVRLGDSSMSKAKIRSPQFIDLPHQTYADPLLDPFFISRAKFMIACQSGPCSYARVFGTPILSLNAVYHYSLIPEGIELVGFKRYLRQVGGRAVELSFSEIVADKLYQLETTQQLEQAGVTLEELTADEIVAATDEMLDWLAAPTRPESVAQERFRSIALKCASLSSQEDDPDQYLRNYLGYAIGTCRVSDAVAKLRPGYL